MFPWLVTSQHFVMVLKALLSLASGDDIGSLYQFIPHAYPFRMPTSSLPPLSSACGATFTVTFNSASCLPKDSLENKGQGARCPLSQFEARGKGVTIATVAGEDFVIDFPPCLLSSCTVQLVKGHLPFSL